MYLILYVVLIVIMSYFIMYLVSDDKNKGDQSKIQIGESRWEGARKSREGYSPSGILARHRGVFRINPTPGS